MVFHHIFIILWRIIPFIRRFQNFWVHRKPSYFTISITGIQRASSFDIIDGPFCIMAIPVVEFSWEGYRIRRFWLSIFYVKNLLFFIEEYKFWDTFFVIDISWQLWFLNRKLYFLKWLPLLQLSKFNDFLCVKSVSKKRWHICYCIH